MYVSKEELASEISAERWQLVVTRVVDASSFNNNKIQLLFISSESCSPLTSATAEKEMHEMNYVRCVTILDVVSEVTLYTIMNTFQFDSTFY